MIAERKLLNWMFTAFLGVFSIFAISVPAFAQSVDLLAEYRFENNLLPLQTGSTLTPWTTANDTNHCNATSGFTSPGLNSWFWTSTGCARGGGFRIDIDADISNGYSIGVRFKFNTIGTAYRKIIDFKNMVPDNGFYFHEGHIMFYPNTSVVGATAYNPNTIYDLVVTRDGSSKQFVAYIVDSSSGTPVVNTEFTITDTANNALPFVTADSKTRLGFFFDDTATGGEATDGGTVYNVRIWRNALSASQILDAMSNHSPVITSNGGGDTASVNIIEASTAVTTVAATDSDSDPLSYRIAGGADAALFSISSSSGVLTFTLPPDYVPAGDADGNSLYEVIVQAADGKGGTGQQALTVRVYSLPPNGVAGHRLWLDADDPLALFGDAACTSPVTAAGSSVACWRDKSVSGSDVIDVGAANGEPTFLNNQFNAKPALEFKKSEQDTLRHVLGTPWTTDYTEFIVFAQQGTPTNYDSFFSNGAISNNHQITYLNGSFNWLSSTRVEIEPFDNALKLYAVRGTGTGTEVFADGVSKNTSTDISGRTFAQYRINQNRAGSKLNNSKIAEVIVYDRALSDCEIETVNTYLGTKWGRDFSNIGTHWDFGTPYIQDVNGIAKFASACPQGQTFDAAVSDIVTINQPSHLLTDEYLLIGNDGTGLATSTDVPVGLDARLTQIWRADTNEANGMAVDVSFDLSTAGGVVDLSDPNEVALLIGSDATMADATSHFGASVNGDIVTFHNIVFSHGDYFTLGHHVPPGLFVHNANAVGYPSLGAPVVVAPKLEVTFNTVTAIDQARVNIAENYQDGADVLGILGQTGTSGTVTVGGHVLTWSWDHSIGVLSFTGSATEPDYQAALRLVTFKNTSGTPTTDQRKITYSLGSGLQYPGNKHFYEFIPDHGIIFSAAIRAAETKTYFGLKGYLVTVTSQGESDFILNKLSGRGGWIAADVKSESGIPKWRWKAGPEGLEDSGQGRAFWEGKVSGHAIGGAFTHWIDGVTPNAAENQAAYFIKVHCGWGRCVPSKWDDIPNDQSQVDANIDGYVVEYGDMPGDPTPHLADDALVNILVPALTLTKTALPSSDVDVNTNLVYTLSYENTGAAEAHNVVLHDTIPTGATYVSSSDSGVLAGSTVTWNLGTVAAGASASVTVTVTAPSTTGAMTNTANLSAQNSPTVQATSTVTVVGPSLTLQKSAPLGVGVGGNITFTLTYNNTGTGTAFNPVLVDTLPAGTTYVGSVPVGAAAAGVVTWNLADIPAGGTGSVTLTVTAPAVAGTITNSAALSADGAGSIKATAAARVTTCQNATLPCLTKGFLPGSIETDPPETSVLTLALDNAIDQLAHSASFTDTLPDGLELAEVPSSPQCGGGTITGAIGGTTLTVSGASLGPGLQSCSITASVRGISAGARVNDHTRISGASSVDLSGAHATLIVTEPILSLTKTARPTSVLVNETVTYTLQYENTGTGNAFGAQLVDPIPAGATFVSATNGGTFAAGNVTWAIGDLAAGASGTVSVVVTAPSFPQTMNNLATLTASNTTTNALDSARVNVFGEPAFALTIDDNPDPVLDGTDLHYLLTLANTGTITATGTTLTMPIPADTTFVSATGGGSQLGGIITWNLGDLAVGHPTSLVAIVHVNRPLPDGTLIDASATTDADNLAAAVVATAQTTVTSKPSLEVTLTATPANVQGGDTITYSIDWTNVGTDHAPGTVLTFTAPASTTIATISGSPIITGSLVTWTIGDLILGQAGSYALTLRVDTGVPNGTVLTAVASLTSTATCGTPAAPCSDTDDATSVVGTASVLELTKKAPSYVAAGGSVTYEFSYANSGNLDAPNMIISDVLPPHTSFTSASAGGVCLDGQSPPGPCTGVTDGTHRVTWDLGTLALGSSGAVHLTVEVETSLADGTPLVNTASLESTATGGPHPASAQTTTTVTSSPALVLLKSGPPRVSAGKQLVYTLAYENAGTGPATNVVLSDHIPTNTVFVSATGGGRETGGVVTWDLGTLPAGTSGSVSIILSVDSQLATGVLLINNASLSGTGTSTLSSQSATTWIVNAPLPALSKASTPASIVAAGQPVTYILDFRNDGNKDMVNGLLTDQVPLGLVPTIIGGGGSYDAISGNISWDLGSFRAGDSGSHTFSILVPVNIPNGALLGNTATLAADNMSALTVAQHLTVTSSPLLEVTKDAPLFADAGGSVTYMLHYRNTGNDTAFNTVLTDILPPETNFITASLPYSHVAGTLTWHLGNLVPGAGGSVIVEAGVQSPLANGTLLVNTASLDASNSQPKGISAVTTVTSVAQLTLSKTAQTLVAAGDQLLYTLAYQNVGTDQATDVVLTDTLPANTTFVSATGGGTHTGGVVTWDVGTLPAGAGATVSVIVAVDPVLPNGTSLVNSASIRSLKTAPVGDVAGTTVVSAPILSVSKTASPGSLVQAGQQIVYTIDYRNDGNEDSLNTVLTDLVPTNVVHPPAVFSSNGGPGAWDAGTGLITWNLGLVPVGGSGTETVTVTVPIATPDGTLIVNSATLNGDDAAPASTRIPLLVGANAVLRLSKVANTAVAVPGDAVTYTIEYQNVGNGLATGAVIIDTVPAFMSFVTASSGGVWNSGARTVAWNLPDLAPGSGGSLTLTMAVDTLTPPADGVILTNSATFDTNETQQLSASVPVSITAPVLTLTKTSSPEPVQAGDDLSYLFVYTNTGNASATGVTIQDPLVPNLTFVAASGGGTYDPGSRTVTWNLPGIAPGDSGNVALIAQVASPLLDGTLIPNEAAIDSIETLAVTSQTDSTVLSAPTLTLRKVATPEFAMVGGQVTYTITAENVGNEDARLVLIQDQIPADTSFVSASHGAIYDANRRLVTWDLATLAAGGGPVSVTLIVAVNTMDNVVITNTARISATNSPPLTASAGVRNQDFTRIPTLSWLGLLLFTLLSVLTGLVFIRKIPIR